MFWCKYSEFCFQPGPDSVGIFAISQSCSGVAARACGLVSLEPTKVGLCISWADNFHGFILQPLLSVLYDRPLYVLDHKHKMAWYLPYNCDIWQIAEILKDRPSWFRDCRSLEVFTMFPAGSGGTIELIYTQVILPILFQFVIHHKLQRWRKY